MKIELKNISKRFDSGWVIKNLNLNIESGDRIAIKGPNGSGKSTLIGILSGYLSQSKGEIAYSYQSIKINRDSIYKHLSLSAAYSELDEELNPHELFNHYKIYKDYKLKDEKLFLQLADMEKHRNKAIKYFSSGMKQRLNLSLAICTNCPLLILDEPTSFLDQSKKEWFYDLMEEYTDGKTIIVASNDEADFNFCTKSIELNPI